MPVNMMNPASQKLKLVQEGTFTTGADNKYAFVLFNPYNWMSTTNVAGRAALVWSTATYTAAVTTMAKDTATVGVASTQFSGPYSASDFSATAGLKYRVAAAGLQVCNVGPRLYKEGTVAGLCEPDHLDISGINPSIIYAYDEVSIVGEEQLDGSWFTIKSNGPAEEGDYAYSNTSPDTPYMGILIQSSGANAQTFRFRAVVHVEVIGRSARGKTPTHSDPQAVSLAASALKHAQATCGKDDHSSHSWWGSLTSALDKGVSAISTLGKGIMKLPGPSMAVRELPMIVSAVTGGGAASAASRAKIQGSSVSRRPALPGPAPRLAIKPR